MADARESERGLPKEFRVVLEDEAGSCEPKEHEVGDGR